MKNKKGQFFIIASVIVIAIILGLTSTINYSLRHPEPVKFYDLSQEFRAESAKIVDYGVYSGLDKNGIETNLDEFSKEFLEKARESDPNLDFVYIYGDKENIHVSNYGGTQINLVSEGAAPITNLAGAAALSISKIRLETRAGEFTRSVNEKMEYFKKIKTDVSMPGDWIKVNIGGVLHNFDLQKNEDFYFVIKTATDVEEVHVVTT